MEKNKKTKLNNGSLKIFKFINLLFEDKAYYSDVIEIFKDEVEEQSANNIQVVLNKHLNTLKVFGLKVFKINNKYRIDSCLYSMNFDFEDLKAISILSNIIAQFPDEEISNSVNLFIRNLMIRMNSNDRNTLNNLITNYDFSFYYSDLREQINNTKQICKQGNIINLIYLDNGKEKEGIFTPVEVVYDTKNAYLLVVNPTKNLKLEVPLPNILKITQLPKKSDVKEVNNSVVYRLKGRLAKTYKLKENEYLSNIEDNGNKIIICKNESNDKLLSRLMRYSNCCEILSPLSLRNQMLELINETINNYNK
ncbi:WYL domain-containing protein [bacterium]|nr:WYL domain-containing protein [bacterium]